MRQKNLYLLCGPAASGKSTFVNNSLKKIHGTHISRDTVRFSIVSEKEDYFSHEKEVFNEFIRCIKEGLILYDNVFVDATHLNEKSRNKVLNRLNLDNVNIIPVNFIIPVETCLERNQLRKGRERVPEDVIIRMHKTFVPANFNEKYTYKDILFVKE